MKFLKEHIIDKLNQNRATKITKIAESIKSNEENWGKNWGQGGGGGGEIKRNLKKRGQNSYQRLTIKCQKLENKDEILKKYAKY